LKQLNTKRYVADDCSRIVFRIPDELQLREKYKISSDYNNTVLTDML